MNEIVYTRAGVCGYTADPDEPDICGRPSDYLVRMRDWPAHVVAGTCGEHALIARKIDKLERIWTS